MMQQALMWAVLFFFTNILILAEAQQVAKYSVSNFAGYSDDVGNGGEAIYATLRNPHDMFFSPSRNSLFFTDTSSIRKVSLTDGKVSIFQNDQNTNIYRGITGTDFLAYYTTNHGVYFTNMEYYSSSNPLAGKNSAGFGGDGGLARNALLNNPTGVFYSNFDNCLYVCDSNNHRIRKVDTNTNIITTIAGNGNNNFYGDGILAINASLSYPQGIYVSQQTGEVYIADTGNNVIRKILTNGTIVTIAGNGMAGFNGDSMNALQSSLNHPVKLSMSADETDLFIADVANNRIRKYNNITGMLTTIVGGGLSDTNAIVATQAQLYEPSSVIRNSLTDELYVIESSADRINKISQSGILTRFCGSLVEPAFNVKPLEIQLGKIYGVSQVKGVFYLSQSLSHKIILGSESEMATQVWGSGLAGFSGDGLVVDSNTQFNFPTSITFSNQTKTIYLADTFNHRIRKIDPITKIITTIAGTGIPGYNGDGIMATSAQLNNPMSVSVWFNGTHDIIYIADKRNHRVRRILPNGIIETVLGTSRSGGGIGSLRNPNSVSVYNDGTLFTADTDNERVCKTIGSITSSVINHFERVQSVLAFNGNLYMVDAKSYIYSFDVITTNTGESSSVFQNPQAFGVSDSSDSIYLADTYYYIIRMFTALSSTRRVIGKYRTNQDGTLATQMRVNNFKKMVTFNGELFVVDGISSVYRIKTDGKIELFAGGSLAEPMQQGTSLESSTFSLISDIHASNGFFYLSDSVARRIWKIDPISKSIISIGGSNNGFYLENVDARTVEVNSNRIVSDSENVYYFDHAASKLRKISFLTGNVTTIAGDVYGSPRDVKVAPLNSVISIGNLDFAPVSKKLYFVEVSPYYLKTISGNSIMLIGYPKKGGLAIASDDTVFVGGNKGVSRLNSDGTFTNITGMILSTDPTGIAVSNSGEVYVSEARKIYKLTPYCDSGYSLNVTWCTPVCFGSVGSSSCGGSIQGSCIAPDTCQCNSQWSGTQCSVLIAHSGTSNNGTKSNSNDQTVLIAVLVPVIIVLFIVVLVVVIVVIIIVYMKVKKQGSVTISKTNSPGNFEMRDVNASTFDQISDFPTDDSYFKPLSSSMSSITNSEATFDPLSRYKELVKIGQGAFGTVFKAFDTKSNKSKALKIIKFKSFGELNAIMKEGMQLMNISHPNILKVNDLFVDKQEILCMDMEFYEKGDLHGFINSKEIISETIVKQIVYQMCSALDFVHSNLKAIHRDVKPSNIFIKSLDDRSIHIILADFGLAKDNQASMALQSYAGTPLYMSPELGLGAIYGPNTDIYSLGVTIFQIMTKDHTTAISHLYLSKDETQVCEILRSKMMECGAYSQEMISVCLRMLTKDASTRPSARDIMKDPYFQ